MGIPKDIIRENKCLKDWNIITGYRGSIAHGMYVPNKQPNSIDDKDVMAICIPPIDHYFGLKKFGSRGTKEIFRGEWDIVVYEVGKFIRLLEKGNPNVLSLLWLDDRFFTHLSDEGKFLIQSRELFIGKHVFHSFTGYAYSQLHKMEHLACKGYMGEKRKQLVTKYGYDTKNASHLIRLLRMGIEFLNEGELHVMREDATELLDIKNGKWSLEKVKKAAERLFERAENAYDLSKLPVKPNHKEINKLMVDILEMRFAGGA